jgi:hypothetical protein
MTDPDNSGTPPQDPPPATPADVVSLDAARAARREAWPDIVRLALTHFEATRDPGPFFDPVLVQELARIESDDLVQWARVKDELKRIKAPVADIQRQLRAAAPRAKGGKGGANEKRKPKPLNFGDLNRLVESFILLYGTDTVWDGESRQIMKIGALRLAFGNDTVKLWLGDRGRKMVAIQNVVFEPGQDLGPEYINLYDGISTEPAPGDCGVMIELLHHLCSESSASDTGVADIMDWVLRWIAYPLQHPGAKLKTALVFHGAQGTGKNLFFDCVRDLYGDYGVMVSQNELEDKFTSWLSRKLFIVGDEVVTRSEMYHKKNQLKWMITGDKKIPIRAIQQDVRYESNHCNLVFLSNESQPLALEDGDRRYLVVYTPIAAPTELYARVAAFLKAGGAQVFLKYLLELDLSGFTPDTKPLMTQAKQDLIDLGLRPAERFAAEWMGGYLPLPLRPCSAEQLYQAFRRWADKMGERFPPPQASFTNSVKRWSQEHVTRDADGEISEPALRYKVVKLAHADGGRSCVRAWIPKGTGPRDGTTEGAWMAECIQDFEPIVGKFCRTASPTEGES